MFVINPGTEPVDGGTLQNAEANMTLLVSDIVKRLPRDLASASVRVARNPDGDRAAEGRFSFTLHIEVTDADDTTYTASHDVEMPGATADRVHYGTRADDIPFDFYRLYGDGSSWLWSYALNLIVGRVNEALNRPVEMPDLPPAL